MTEFSYRALDPAGITVRGSIQAENSAEAAMILRQRGIIAYRLHAAAMPRRWLRLSPPPQKRTTHAWRSDAMRKLSTLMSAGVAIDRALQLLLLQSPPAQRPRVEALLNAVRGGAPLSAALARDQAGFEDHDLALIRLGEQSGELAVALDDLAQILDRRAKLRADALSALVYPIFLLIFAVLSIIVISLILAPRMAPLFDHNPEAIPLSLRLLMGLSSAVHQQPIALGAGVLLAMLLLVFAARTGGWKERLLRAAGRFPPSARVLARFELARVSAMLASLLESGASLQAAIGSSAQAAMTETTGKTMLAAREAVQGGRKLSQALAAVPVFDAASLQLIAVAEETNRLEPVLRHIASAKEGEAQQSLARSMALLTPLLTVLTGVLVGGIVMSVMDAILSANDLALQ